MNDEQLVEAIGAGSDRFDLPVLFYLTHQKQIEEWASLKSTVADAVGEWFQTTVRDDLAGLAGELGLVVSYARGPQKHRSLLLHPHNTPIVGGKPIIGAGFTWRSGTVNPSTSPPFASVRCSAIAAGKEARLVFSESGGRAFRESASGKGKGDNVWPVWWWINTVDNWWTDLDGYRAHVVDNVRRIVIGTKEAVAVAASTAASADLTGADDPDE
jgi:hypothetical protein